MKKQISIPGRRPQQTKAADSGSGALFGVLGAIGAGALAIPTGGASLAAMPAILGAAGAGAGLGSLLGNVVNPGNQAEYKQMREPAPVSGQGDDSALFRRMQQRRESAVQSLAQADQALQGMPKNIQQQYSPIIKQALEYERQKERYA
jgi:hypothetical protein